MLDGRRGEEGVQSMYKYMQSWILELRHSSLCFDFDMCCGQSSLC
jgi:hypothetical protein